jgi:hypothetical protein
MCFFSVITCAKSKGILEMCPVQPSISLINPSCCGVIIPLHEGKFQKKMSVPISISIQKPNNSPPITIIWKSSDNKSVNSKPIFESIKIHIAKPNDMIISKDADETQGNETCMINNDLFPITIKLIPLSFLLPNFLPTTLPRSPPGFSNMNHCWVLCIS